jgi:hypothetical protein
VTDSWVGETPPGDGLHGLPKIPGYEILQELSHGGMGVVYKARQLGLDRVVALKMILAGAAAGPDLRTRFRTEGEAVARLQHPNSVQVFDVGEFDGLPYFSMEFCPGGNLLKKLAGTPLPPEEAAALAEVLARGVSAAHAAGVVHRDLKPANILLDAAGTPKITDFGLATKLDEATAGETGVLLGTPNYMAPEQAEAKGRAVGPLADVYSLGAILYECLTGRPPFVAANRLEVLVQVVVEEPVPPRRLNPTVPLDLYTVTRKCLEKKPADRYSGAGALADDLRRFLAGEPVRARPVSRVERGWRWAGRNRAVAGLLAALAVAALGWLGGGGWFTWRLDAARRAAEENARQELRAREQADRDRHEAEQSLYYSQIGRAESSVQAGEIAAAEQALDATRPDLRGWEYGYLRRSASGTLLVLHGHTESVQTASLSPDGGRIVTASYDGTARIWDCRTGAERVVLRGHTWLVTGASFSPDGGRIVTASQDMTARIRDARAGADFHTLHGSTGGVAVASFSPDGARIVTRTAFGDGLVWDAVTGQLRPDEIPEKGPPGSSTSPDGASQVVLDGNRVLVLPLRRPAGAYDTWAEDADRRRLLAPQRHAADYLSALSSGDGFAADFHLARLRAVEPADAPGRFRRGLALLRGGHRTEGLADLTHPQSAGDMHRERLEWRARACLLRGDREGYRSACAARLTLLGPYPSSLDANDASWLCCFGPGATDDPAAIARLARPRRDCWRGSGGRGFGGDVAVHGTEYLRCGFTASGENPGGDSPTPPIPASAW